VGQELRQTFTLASKSDHSAPVRDAEWVTGTVPGRGIAIVVRLAARQFDTIETTKGGGGVMRIIDQATWPRRDHFRLYGSFDFPHVGMTVQVDITALWANRARTSASPSVTLVYVITKAANRVPELRQRIHGEQVVEYEMVHPSLAVLGDDEVFGVVNLDYDDDFSTFASGAAECIEATKERPSMVDFPHGADREPAKDDVLSMSVIPWLSFTGFSLTRHPKVDAVPLIVWGKVLEDADADRALLPLFVNFHHALVDGLHVARFVGYIEEEARELAAAFG
jgi:chloramphenicol O-acetyltransferase type A